MVSVCQEERSYKIFDKVTEDEYRAIVKGRLEEDDFIEDDDGSGYVDNGLEEDWNKRNSDSEDGSESDGGEGCLSIPELCLLRMRRKPRHLARSLRLTLSIVTLRPQEEEEESFYQSFQGEW